MKSHTTSLKASIYRIIFGTDTREGKLFDLVLLYMILASIAIVMLDSIASIKNEWGYYLNAIEWILTILFTLEYLARIWSSKRPEKYIFSFYGIVDVLAILPTYAALFLTGAHYLMVIRVLRLLRVFRILKLTRQIQAAQLLGKALFASRHKIMVFMGVVFSVVLIFGTIMYVVEGPENGFTSIPISIYWAIVTVTTVGYGDISPMTSLGRVLASVLMFMGYAIIAVPTGIVTAELAVAEKELKEIESGKKTSGKKIICTNCAATGHTRVALHCWRCGYQLKSPIN